MANSTSVDKRIDLKADTFSVQLYKKEIEDDIKKYNK